jgi:hemolysin activation/secretion protein
MRYSRLIACPFLIGLTLGCVGAVGGAPRGAAAQAASKAGSTPATFDVEAYDVDGAKLLQQIDVETAVYPFLGPGRTAADINHAREALEKAYRDRGFQTVVVELPPQSVSDNIVRLHVIEAPVGRVRVTGARFFSPEFIRREAPAFKEGEVPNIDVAQKELAAINRLPDRRVAPLLHAGQAPGTVDVDLTVSDTLPLHASTELNNDHSLNTPPLRSLTTIHYDNLWQLGHSISFTYSVAPENRSASEIYVGSYVAPVWGTPWSIQAFGYQSNSNVATVGSSTVLGKGYDIGLRAVFQFPPMGDLSQSVSFGGDYKTSDQDGFTNPGDPCLVTNPAKNIFTNCILIHYWPLNLTYSAQREGSRFSTKASLSLTAGLAAAGSGEAVFQDTRFNANPNFIHFNVDLTQTEALGRGFEAAQHLTGQYSGQPLTTSEQFSLGGLTSVRGYLQSEVVGDDGFTGSLEIRSPSLAPEIGSFVDELRLYGFADGGVAHVVDPLPQQTGFFDLASVGLGLRLELFKHLSGDVAGAIPLISGPTTPLMKTPATRSDRPRLTFSLKSEF